MRSGERSAGWTFGVAALIAAVAAGGCKRAASSGAGGGSTGAGRAQVTAIVDLPNGPDLGAAAPLIEGFKASAGAAAFGMVRDQIGTSVGADNLRGVDLSKSIRLVVADPARFERPVAALVHVQDEAALRKGLTTGKVIVRGKLALIGDRKVIGALAGYAFGTLAKKPLPAHPHASIVADPFRKAFEAGVDDIRSDGAIAIAESTAFPLFARRALEKYFQYCFSVVSILGTQTQRVEVSGGFEQAGYAVSAVIYPEPGSALARFFAAQSPSDFRLVSRLPAGSSPRPLVVGHLVLGPARPAFAAAAEQLLKVIIWGMRPKIRDALVSVISAGTGEMAIAYAGARNTYSGVFEVTDARKAKRMADRLAGHVLIHSRRISSRYG